MAFSTEALISIKIELSIMWIKYYDKFSNSSWLKANLDLLEKTQNQTRLMMAMYQ